MEVNVVNMKGKKVSSLELPSNIFEAPINVDLMHQAYVRQMANARLGTHETKVRSDVSGGGRKPWRQKGTGRARTGSIRAAQWKGGGKIHTPHPRQYTQTMPRKMRRAALKSALSVKAADTNIIIVDQLSIPEPKTALMAEVLNKLVGDSSALILIPNKEEYSDIIRSSDNLPGTKVLLSSYINIRDLLVFEKLILPVVVIEKINTHLG